jgi:hypothetical protein
VTVLIGKFSDLAGSRRAAPFVPLARGRPCWASASTGVTGSCSVGDDETPRSRPTGKRSDLSSWCLLDHESDSAARLLAGTTEGIGKHLRGPTAARAFQLKRRRFQALAPQSAPVSVWMSRFRAVEVVENVVVDRGVAG